MKVLLLFPFTHPDVVTCFHRTLHIIFDVMVDAVLPIKVSKDLERLPYFSYACFIQLTFHLTLRQLRVNLDLQINNVN